MRRKGIPCGPDCCSPSKHCVKAINNVSPDPNGDLTLKAGNGIAIYQTGDDEITIINDAITSSFVAGDNIEINPSGSDLEIRVTDDVSINSLDVSQDVNIGGDLNITGDIIQQGSSYETHAEQVYTTKDYIYMRDGAVSGLSVGDFSGFQVKKYDGANDGRLVIDKEGVARVGDVGDEQPLLTRDESNDLTDGQSLVWDGTNQKAVTEAIPGAINTALNGKISGSGNIGSDTRPIKIVNGVATALTNNVMTGPLKISNAIGSNTYPTWWLIKDSNGVDILEWKFFIRSDGGVNLYVRIRNADGTFKDVGIAQGD